MAEINAETRRQHLRNQLFRVLKLPPEDSASVPYRCCKVDSVLRVYISEIAEIPLGLKSGKRVAPPYPWGSSYLVGLLSTAGVDTD
ncbi:hypothetical protein P5673_007536 [Acropora cervicornis]|uniref:Uncharacterized protein n=1 Tax=Acropora cervicornis TaxID=6130 RepID=A0AAD9QVX4_ACRCE|nr:hypothetical protein P5673_007536 [Acropora cervicornis]